MAFSREFLKHSKQLRNSISLGSCFLITLFSPINIHISFWIRCKTFLKNIHGKAFIRLNQLIPFSTCQSAVVTGSCFFGGIPPFEIFTRNAGESAKSIRNVIMEIKLSVHCRAQNKRQVANKWGDQKKN